MNSSQARWLYRRRCLVGGESLTTGEPKPDIEPGIPTAVYLSILLQDRTVNNDVEIKNGSFRWPSPSCVFKPRNPLQLIEFDVLVFKVIVSIETQNKSR